MKGREQQEAHRVLKQPGRRSTRNRLVVLLSMVLLGGMLLLPRIVAAVEDPYSSISPESQDNRDILFLYKIIFWLAVIVFIGVQAGIVWSVLRYRRRHENEPRPEQIHGNQKLEVIWTIIPAVILVAIFIPSVRTMYRIDDRAQAESEYVIEVYGKQWWWEVHYKEPEAVADVVTANEIYIPVNTRVQFDLLSSNVIHSFYVPQLAGKMDLIPGHTNVISIKADRPGMYYGECAEFCGESHAYMRFKIIAVEQAEFDKFILGWKQGASQDAASLVPDGDVERIPQDMSLCIACHRVGGVPENAAGDPLQNPAMGVEGGTQENQILGPNLSMLACRTTLAGGIVPNDEEHLREWLHNPGGVKQGNFMATMIKEGTLSGEQIDAIVAYLKTLHPDAGCPVITGVHAESVQRLVDESPPAETTADSTSSDAAYVNERRNKS